MIDRSWGVLGSKIAEINLHSEGASKLQEGRNASDGKDMLLSGLEACELNAQSAAFRISDEKLCLKVSYCLLNPLRMKCFDYALLLACHSVFGYPFICFPDL